MAQLQIVCLGAFQITLDGMAPTAFITDKVRALLVYLAIEGQVQQRSRLAQFLWPGYSEESARNSLRQSLHLLRQFLKDTEVDPPWLVLTRQTVQINPDAATMIDVVRFRQLVADYTAHTHATLATCARCLARLREAVDLYRGDFLANLAVIDSDPFEEWRRVTQEHLHIQMLDALSHLIKAAESTGDTEGVLQLAQRQLTMEPWLETAHRQIMRALAQRGQRTAALAQYQRCCQVLNEELGVAPDTKTTALYEQIQSSGFEKKAERQEEKAVATPSAPPPLGNPRPRAALLPVFPTPLVGRAQALAEIDQQLQRPEVRLLTLVGPGGMGKTRLAVEAGQTRQGHFTDGVFFVPLAPISTPDALGPALATALGLTLQGDDPRLALLQSLGQQQRLLILDNFEHLLVGTTDAIDLVVDLLEAAPGVQLLVTSRERLNLRSEQLYPVQALSFSATATLAEASASAAVRLFVQSVQRVYPDFHLTAANLAAILRICQLVQGMPLGLELAAANVGGAPLNAIADAIAQSAEFLAVEWRDMPARQRSMRAIFAWSWDLLTIEEQRALRQVSIFRGGFDYTAFKTVTGATLPLLTRLFHKSLLQRQETISGEPRYLLHELLRQFAEEQLQHAPTEATALATRHSIYYLDFVASREKALTRHHARQAADDIQEEINNIRQAWRWAATHQGTNDTASSEALSRAAYGLWKFYSQRGPRSESEQMLQIALQPPATVFSADPIDPQNHQQRQATMSKLLALHATSLVVTGKLDDAAEIARQAMALGQTYGNIEGETMGAVAQAQAIAHLHRFGEARQLFEEALQLLHRYQGAYGSSEVLAEAELTAYEYLANVTYDLEGFQTSRKYIIQSLELCQRLGRELNEQECHYTLAILAGLSGDYATAQHEYREALTLARRLGNQMGEMFALIGLGETARLQGAYLDAQAVIEQGLTLACVLNDRFGQINALVGLTHLHCLLGSPAHAADYSSQLVQILETRELLPENRVLILDALAFYAHCTGQAQQALAYAEQTQQLLANRARSSLTLGHIRASLQDWQGALIAYQIAADRHTKRGNRAAAAEAQAGLAYIALAQNDLAEAQAQVETILLVLSAYPRAGFNEPFFIYLTAYRVLAATGDQRAAALLHQGYDLLQQDAAALDNERRQRFLTAVPIHRDLIAAYDGLQIGVH